jgi:hypothetical protein
LLLRKELQKRMSGERGDVLTDCSMVMKLTDRMQNFLENPHLGDF